MQRRDRHTVWKPVRIQLRREALAARFLLAALAVVIVSGAILSGVPAWAQGDLGTWLNTDKKGKLNLRECGTDSLCANIVWLKEPNDEEGRPWQDRLNPDPEKRGRPVVGIDVLEGVKKIAPNTWRGQIYDPEVGKTYYLKHLKLGENKVEIRGCLSSGWPCRTKYWTRSTPITPPGPPVQVASPRPAPKASRPVQPPPTLAQPAPRPVAPPVQRQASVQPRPPQPAPRPVQRQASARPPLPAARPPAPRPVAPSPPAQAALPWQGQVAKAAPAPPVSRPPAVTGSVARSAIAVPPGSPGYLVQVTAGQDQGEALRTFGKLQQLYPNLLGGYMPDIQKVNLGPKGVWYRIRVGPMQQRTAAVNFCQQLKAAGADCLIRRQ